MRLRIPPHSVQAEQSLLGALMQGGNTWERVADQVKEGDFYRREHRTIFAAIKSLAEGDEPCDLVTVTETLERREELEDAGGLPYVGRLVQGTSSVANIEAYARIVRYHSVLRQLIAAGTDIADLAYNPKDRKPPELLDEAERKVFAIAEQLTRGGGFAPIKSLLVKAVERIDRLYNSNEAITGLPTGFDDLDERTSGLAERGPDHRGRAPLHGQDLLRHEHRRERGHRDPEAGGGVQHGDARRLAGHAHDVVPGTYRSAPGTHRQAGRRRMAAADLRGQYALQDQDLYRRHAGAQSH